MVVLYNIEEELFGDKIICEARRISEINVVNKTGRYKSQKIQLKDNAKCRILK